MGLLEVVALSCSIGFMLHHFVVKRLDAIDKRLDLLFERLEAEFLKTRETVREQGRDGRPLF